MSKELEKTYNPGAIEERLYDKWMEKKVFPCRSGPKQKTLYHCNAAAQYHRPASHGTCAGQYHAGYPDPL